MRHSGAVRKSAFFGKIFLPHLTDYPGGAKPLHFVDKEAALQACIADCGRHVSIAFDLEFDAHRHSYGVTLCVVQIATPAASYVIDALAGLDHAGMFALFADAGIEKIVHSPGEDLRLLHSLGCIPQHLFDTEVAAKLLNYEQTSLSAMLQSRLGITLNKGQQRSNWLRRPLTQAQLEYAAADVSALHGLKAVLLEEAEAKGLMPFVQEEQDALSTTIYTPERKESFLKAGDLRYLSPYDQHVLNGLFLFRDELARKLNRPAFQVMDESLLREVFAGRISPAQAPFEQGIYGGFRNERFGRQLAGHLQALRQEAEALGLSRQRPPREYDGEARLGKAELQAARERVFAPIQQELASRFGDHAARFILSNGSVTELLRGNLKLGQIKRDYKRKLITDIAASRGVDLGAYW